MKINVTNIAKLANLEIDEEENKSFEKQLSEILNYVEKLKELDTKTVSETSQVIDLENVKKEDRAIASLSQKEVLSNTKSKHNGLFKTDAILTE